MKIPENLEEAIEGVYSHMDRAEEAIIKYSESQFVARVHNGFGSWIRNNWGLWGENSPLAFWFLSHGIKHPDDMSDIILTCAWRKYHGYPHPYKIEELFEKYKTYWNQMGGFKKEPPGKT